MGTRGSLVGIRGGMRAQRSAIRSGNRVRTHRSRVAVSSLRVSRHLRFLVAFGKNARGIRDISSTRGTHVRRVHNAGGTLQTLRFRARRLPNARTFPIIRPAMGMPADDLLAPAREQLGHKRIELGAVLLVERE